MATYNIYIYDIYIYILYIYIYLVLKEIRICVAKKKTEKSKYFQFFSVFVFLGGGRWRLLLANS